VIACVVSLIILGLSIWIVVIFIAENDKGAAWFPKSVVVTSLCLSCITVLMLPFDIANTRDPTSFRDVGGGLDMTLMWTIILWAVAVMVVVIIPFTTFFYEAYDPDQSSMAQQITPATMYTFAIVFLFGTICTVLWITIGFADIPYYAYQTNAQTAGIFDSNLQYNYLISIEVLELPVSYFVYVVGLISAVGWLLFCVYGGVGLSALPVEIMSDWMSRPKPMSANEYVTEKESIAGRAGMLQATGKKLEHAQRVKNNQSLRNKINAFKAEVMELESQYRKIEISFKQNGMGAIKIALWLMLGIFGGMLSILWIMHVMMYNTLQINPFLNTFLKDLDRTFSLLGVIMYAILAFYLLWCAVKGCIKVGMRIVFFQIHPMRLGDTLMNSMLFNAGLILLCSVTVTQFCVESFRIYASNTVVDTLLNAYVKRLKYIGTAMMYFQLAFIIIALLSIFWVILCPRAKVKTEEVDEDEDVK
jgi:LMBR1 domain-containing protein 1